MPVGITGALSLGGSIASGVIGSNAAGNAAAAANNAAKQANSILSGVQTTTNNNLQPFVNTGQTYNSALEGLLGVGGDPTASRNAFDNYLNSTNYNFQLGQGENAIETANAPAYGSGATAKALNNYAQGQAGSALQGYEGLLSTGVGQGIGAAGTLGGLSNQNAQAQGNNLLAAAGVQGSSDIYGANSINNAIKGGVSALSSFGNTGASALSGLGNFFAGGFPDTGQDT
jgi:hypothetical protein